MPVSRRRSETNRRGQTGKINLVAIGILVAIVAIAYFSYKFAPPYIDDRYGMERFLMTQARQAYELTDEKIRRNIQEYAATEGIELREGMWTAYRSRDTIYIKVKYDRLVTIPFGLSRLLRFEHDIEMEIKPPKQL